MNIDISRLVATSGQLLLAQFVWTTPATLTAPAGWVLIRQVDGTGLSQAIYRQAGPLTRVTETWVLSQDQQWAANLINVGTATLETSAQSFGTGSTTSIVGPPGAALSDLAIAFYGTAGNRIMTGVQSPGVQINAPLSAFWEYHAAYLSAINFAVTFPQSQNWVEIQVIVRGSPAITPTSGLAANTCPTSAQSGG